MESEKINKFKFLRHRAKRKASVYWGKVKLRWHEIKYIGCIIRDEYTSIPHKEIKAEELKKICETLPPSFSSFMENLFKHGLEINEESRKYLFDVFHMRFFSLLPKGVRDKNFHNLVEEIDDILIKLDNLHYKMNALYYKKIMSSSLYSMVLDAESVLDQIKDKGLEKHIVFYKHRSSYASGESFWSAAKQFLAEKSRDNSDDEYCADTRMLGYMSQWSFIFNRKVVNASFSIEIKNLKIIDNLEINFKHFTCVMFNRNMFCESVKMQAKRGMQFSDKNRSDGFIFYKNIFYRDCSVNFKDIHYFIFDRNDFKHDTCLFNFPCSQSTPPHEDNDVYPTIRLINNKVRERLIIRSRKLDDDNVYIPVKIEFLRKNRLAKLHIDTDNNELSETVAKSDINNISFDVQEKIKPVGTDLNLLRQYKNFFLKLKDEAIEKKIDRQNLTMLEKNGILMGDFHLDGKTN